MTYYETDSGGFVFSAGSLCFGGSLVQDINRPVANLSQKGQRMSS
jgi:hypothetical protein